LVIIVLSKDNEVKHMNLQSSVMSLFTVKGRPGRS